MGLPIGQKLVKSGSTWAIFCGTHISETAEWIYTIQSSMELSRPVVVQHHGHFILTLGFQGQILKMRYLRNGRASWHGTKRMWVDRMLDPHCDLEIWPQPWPWPQSCDSGITVRNPLLLCPLVLAQDGGTRSRQKCLHRDFSATVLNFTTEMHQSVGNGMREFCDISKLTTTTVDANDLTSRESQC